MSLTLAYLLGECQRAMPCRKPDHLLSAAGQGNYVVGSEQFCCPHPEHSLWRCGRDAAIGTLSWRFRLRASLTHRRSCHPSCAGTDACFVIDAGSYLVAAYCAYGLRGAVFLPQPLSPVSSKGCVAASASPRALMLC